MPSTSKVPQAAADPAQLEVKELLAQSNIDPLTRYLDRHGSTRSALTEQVRSERDKRCTQIADTYAAREKTVANLERLEKGYRYSCPVVVQAFSAQVTRSDAPATPGETAPGGVAATASPAPSVPSAGSDKDKASFEKCYLPFAIKNYREAYKVCKAPAAMGDARAQYDLGFSARVLQLYPEAVQWTQRSAEQGLPEAQLHLGQLYQQGQGLPKSQSKAAEQFGRAAAQGLAEAQYMTGLTYYRGEGVRRDAKQALHWFSLAAAQGHGNAQLYVGRMYVQGEGVAVDKKMGHKWLLSAAERRVAQAQFQVGMMYAQGIGVDADEVQAYIWLNLALAGGLGEAAAPRDKIALKLSPAQLANAQQRSRRMQESMH
ncbi:MAG: tetratricopeptide repeat protein [Rhodoferax sp.]|nr:tetratricopeptide repeat protein [Rhodoferax sp.]